MAKLAINEIVHNYCKNNGYSGLQCIDYTEPFSGVKESCSCTLDELKESNCINSECFPLKLYLHSDGQYYRWEEIVEVKESL